MLRLTPWRRGPLLLARRPGVALALTAAAFVAALPAAAAPLFLSSAENATLHRQVAESCPWQVGLRVTNVLDLTGSPEFGGSIHQVGTDVYRRRNEIVTTAAPAGLTPATITLAGDVDADPVGRPSRDPNVRGLNLIGQDGFAEHVQVVEGPAAAGIWLPDTFAADQGLRVGDRVRLTNRTGGARPPAGGAPEPQPYEVPVAAVFRDLRSLPDQAHWCSLRDLYRGRPGQEYSNEPVFPLALIDTETFLQAGTAMRLRASHWLEYAVADPTSPAPAARGLAERIDQARSQLMSADTTVLNADFANRTGTASLLDRQVRRAALVRDGLLPPVVPITVAGVLVGFAVVAAAALFWVQRRRQELTVLAAHGVGAPGLGLKAVTEALPALVLGAAGGGAAAWALVRWTGPSPVGSAGARPVAAGAVLATAVVALGLVGLVAAIRCTALTDQPATTRRRHRSLSIPWELLPLAAAPVAWFTMTGARTTEDVADGVGVGDVAHVPARLLVVPILVIAGAAILAGRLIAGRLRARGLRRTPKRHTVLLAWRRIVRDATATAVLAAATAVPIAMAAYGATVTDSIRTTADAELRMLLGSDAVAVLKVDDGRGGTGREGDEAGREGGEPAVPAALAGSATEIWRINGLSLDGTTVDVLVVDPESFPRGAFWDGRIPGATLGDAVGLLAPAGLTGERPTVVASGQVPPGDAMLTLLGDEVPVQVVAVRPLPGEQSNYPVVLVHRDLLAEDPPCCLASRQWWIRGAPAEIRSQIAAAGAPLARFTTIDDLRVGSLHEPVTYTFQYLVALSVFTGLIAVVGLLLYLESRTAAHRRGYVVLRRLGLRPGAHRRALLMELGWPLLAGLAGGLALVAGLAYALGGTFEIDPVEQPGAIVALPLAMVGLVCATALAIAVGAAAFAHRRVSRADPSEVLRDTA